MRIPWEQINHLHRHCTDLKLAGNFEAMIPLHEEILRLLQNHGADADHISNAFNALASLNLKLRRYLEAEAYARWSVSYYEEQKGVSHEKLATYLHLLSTTLAIQGKFEEAIPIAERSIAEFSVFHTPEDDFLRRCKSDLADLRVHKASDRFEFA